VRDLSFVNTREELGERATLDGLIDGTLEVLRDDSEVELTSASGGLFKNHLGLKTIVLPNFRLRSGQYFSTAATTTETSIYLPVAETIVIKLTSDYYAHPTTSVFTHCDYAKVIDSYKYSGSGISTNLFYRCKSLNTLIIRNTALVALGSLTAFTYTPFASDGTGGTLYVPSSLIAIYQSATNWSTILGYENNQILPIEGSIYDGYYADGSPIE
jgi:hypothetical protein